MRIAFAALLVSLALPAAADPPRPPRSAAPRHDARTLHDDDCALARAQHRTCTLTMGREDVGGNTPGATGTKVRVLTLAKQPSLIRVRREFVVEILRSAEDL